MVRTLREVTIGGPAGRLEGLLELPEEEPGEVALVCHPHPLYGGTMRNKVVHRIARGLGRNGAAVLRFNFRGVEGSEGEYGNWLGEVEDARACLGWLRQMYPGRPFTLAGFSFGAITILRLGCAAAGAARLIAAGYPTREGMAEGLAGCTAPKIFIQSTHDQYGPRADMEAMFSRLAEPKRLLWIEATDHFFATGLAELEETVFRLGSAAGNAERQLA